MGLADLISAGFQSFDAAQALEEGVSPKEIIMEAFEQTVGYLYLWLKKQTI